MFDVAWTEPVETVGQRKNRKDKASNRLSRELSIRTESSKSSDSSLAPARPSLFTLFNNTKKRVSKNSNSSPKVSSANNERNTRDGRRISSYTVTSDLSIQGLSKKKITTTEASKSNSFDDGRNCDTETEVSSPSGESIFSGWTARSSAATESSWRSGHPSGKGERVQPLSRNSYVTQNTETTTSPRDSIVASERVATVVHITSAGIVPIQAPDSPTKSSPTASIFNFPIPRLTGEASTIGSLTGVAAEDIVLRPSGSRSDAGKYPENWECTSLKVESAKASPRKPLLLPQKKKDRKQSLTTSELSLLQKTIRKMDAASSKIVLERLKEEWTEVVDASVYRELELEKQLWMLAGLKALNKDKSATNFDKHRGVSTATSRKMLSLYENQASSSFLSASYPAQEIYHLSPYPLSPRKYPNIHPLAVSGPTSRLPYASDIFASIHAFSLPAILPASSIPALLMECHRILNSSQIITSPETSPTTQSFPMNLSAGSLHLTILDPSPLPTTLGPRLRAWLDTHLLINLERQFRCINPARLFPIWLADARLRAEGSTITNTRFLASVSTVSCPSEHEAFSMIDGTGKEEGVVNDVGEVVKQELKSMVGRMLWKEMWGPFVEGKEWWWENSEVMEECERVGTCWEYAVIEAVKEG